MPKLSLRAYNREISSLIDRGQTDEAVAHCQYILQTYPKHLESYRLLGKAYLEAHRYPEAIDIFQRVLAVVPDDFITHVGMSIIRNDENNLDAAIWHMERAFEVQPSNQAIQDELKHLYGRRDGQEPQKIRLTRGALCRMYARGNQTRQAIAEIKSILAEDPERMDIQVLLARMYYLSNMTNEAVDLSRKILEKVPFCYDTNKLMIEILVRARKVKDTDPYKQKLVALDPYEALLSDPSTSVEEVPEDAISLDKLYFDPATRPSTQSQRPAPQMNDTEEVAPDWLISDLSGMDDLGAKGFTRILDASVLPAEPGSAESEPRAPVKPPAVGTQPVSTEVLKEEPLPSWLQDSYNQQPGASTQAPTPSQAAPAQPEAIPDFLKMTGWAAAGTIDESTPAQVIPPQPVAAENDAAPGDIPDWLQSLAPESASQPAAGGKEDEFSNWLNQLDNTAGNIQQTGILSEEKLNAPAEPASQLPDWLRQTAKDAQVDITPPPAAARPAPQQPAPPPVQPPAPVQPAVPAAQPAAPERRAPIQPKPTGSLKFTVDENFPIAGGTTILSPDDIPDWLQEIKPGSSAPKAPEANVFAAAPSTPAAPPSAPSGLQDVTTTQLSPDEKQEVPDWLRDIQAESPAMAAPVLTPEPSTPVGMDSVITTKLTPEEKSEVPDWLRDLQPTETETPQAPEVNLPPTASSPAIPSDWLAKLQTGELSAQAVSQPPAQAAPPDWLSQVEAPAAEETAAPVGSSIWMDQAEEPPAAVPAEVPDWLNQAPQPEPTPPPAAAPAEMPDWLSQIKPAAEAAPAAEPQAEMPDWMTPSQPEPEAQAGSPADIPDWMKEMPAPAQPEPEPQAVAPADIPDWMKEMPAPSQPEPVAQAAAPAEIPDWMAPAQPEPVAQPAAEAPDWMAASEPAQPAETAEPAEMPDWMKEIPSAAQPEPAAEAQLPDWMTGSDQTGTSKPTGGLPDDYQPDMMTAQLTPEEKEEMPDWLKDISPEPEAVAEPIIETPVVAEQESVLTTKLPDEAKSEPLPEWLNEIQPEPVAAVPSQELPEDQRKTAVLPEEEHEEVEQMPDWLHMLEQESPEAAPEPVAEVPVPPAPVSPPAPVVDQFVPSDTEPTEERPTTSILPTNPEAAAEEMPEWLKEIDGSAGAISAPTPLSEPVSSGEDFPDWLKSYPTPSTVETPISANEPAPEAVANTEVPTWLEEIQTTAPESTESALPAWLKDFEPEAAVAAPVAEEAAPVLPDWLQDTEAPAPVVEEPVARAEEIPAVQPVEIPVMEEFIPTIITPVEEPTLVAEPAAEVPTAEETLAQMIEPEPAPEMQILEEMSPVIQLPEEPTAEVIEPVAEQPVETQAPTQWVPEKETEPQFTQIRKHETVELRGTQALSLDESATPGMGFAVPADSILADESAAAAAAAIGIPLFAQGSTGEEEAPAIEEQPIQAVETQLEELAAPEPALPEAVAEEAVAEPEALEEPVAGEQPIAVEEAPVVEQEPASELVEESVAVIEEPVAEVEPVVEAVIEEPLAEVPEVEAVAEEPIEPAAEVVEAEVIALEEVTEEVAAEEPVESEPILVEEPAAEPVFEEAAPEEVVAEVVAEVVEPEPVAAEETPEPIVEEKVEEVVLPEAEPVLEEVVLPMAEEEPIAAAIEEEAPVVEIPVVAEPVAVAVAPKKQPVVVDYDKAFSAAKKSLKSGDISASLPHFNNLIQAEQQLDGVIAEVQKALDKHPLDFNLWMVLGDAYGRTGSLQKALDAYTKAEEYLQ